MTGTDLKTQLTLLKSLQDIDVSIHAINVQIAAIQPRIDEAAAEFKKARDAVIERESQKAEIEKKKRALELDLQTRNDQLRERESKLYAIKTNKEYQAAIKEIADAKQAGKEQEEQILSLMEKIDALNEEIKQLSSGIADKEKAFREKEAELKKEEAALLAERESKQALKNDAERNIDKKVLSEYRFVQKRYSDAMALAIGGVCSGCNKRIPPQVYIELQKWNQLISCTNCHRLLFFEEAKENGQAGQK